MDRRPLLTVLRGFLLSLFMLGGPGLPLVDALLWHGSAAEQVAGSRVDAPGATRTHADTCSLAALLPGPGLVPCMAPPLPALRAAQRGPAAHQAQVRITTAPDGSTRPRAPPTLSA